MGHLRCIAGTVMEDLSFDFEAEIDAKDALRKASLKADGTTSSESAAVRGRHSIVCKHWLRNLCMKGDKCDFLHQYDPNRMPECVFWLKSGKCNDPDCIFRHVQASERPECQRYRLGFCRYGPMCRSRHDRLPRDALPELLPDWFLDSLVLNAHLIPNADDVRLSDHLGRDRRNGHGNELALVPVAPVTEQGTIPGLLSPIHGKCRYFVMRSMNNRNIQISAAKGIWATSVGNSSRLRQAFKDVDHAILIFSATESRNFQGYAKMMCEPDDTLFPGVWGDMTCRLGANFRVHWIKQCSARVDQADHITNPQNEDLPVRRCRAGQEIPSSVGEQLCRFLWQQAEVDLLKGSELEFEPRASYEYPVPALKDNDVALHKDADKANGGGPLAIEDVKKDGDDDRSRPAPAPLGTFQREAREGKVRPGSAAPVTVGKALASGSSSILGAMAEDAHRHGHPPGMWMPPMGWRPMMHEQRPPGEWMPGRMPPPPGYMMPPSYRPCPYPPGPGAPPPHGEAHPPGYWGERLHCTQPPTDWHGASSGLADPRAGADGRARGRSRSKARRRHKHRK